MTTTELTLPQRAAVALGTAEHETRLALLAEEAKSIVQIKNKDGREQCHSLMMTLKNARVAIEKAGKAAREDAQAFSKAVIAEEKRLIAITEAEESRLQGLRDKWDADREAERQAKIEAERRRVAAIRERIESVRALPLQAVGKSAVEISSIIFSLSTTPDYSQFEEFADEFKAVRFDAIDKLAKAETAQRNAEVEAARLKAEREELARLRAEAEARRQEQERIASEERARQEAELAEARRKQEAELAAQRAEIARQQAEREAEAARQAQATKDAQDAAQAKLDAERAELDRQRAEVAAAAAEAKRAADDAAERARQEERQRIEPQPISLTEVLHAAAPRELAGSIAPRAPSLRLGQINERLGFTVTADFLTNLGFSPAATDKSAKLYHDADFPRICDAIAQRSVAVGRQFAAQLAA